MIWLYSDCLSLILLLDTKIPSILAIFSVVWLFPNMAPRGRDLTTLGKEVDINVSKSGMISRKIGENMQISHNNLQKKFKWNRGRDNLENIHKEMKVKIYFPGNQKVEEYPIRIADFCKSMKWRKWKFWFSFNSFI